MYTAVHHPITNTDACHLNNGITVTNDQQLSMTSACQPSMTFIHPNIP